MRPLPRGRVGLAIIVTFVIAALAIALCLTLSIRSDDPIDFAVYYMAGYRLSQGDSPYNISLPAWKQLGDDLGIARFAWPYRYPPHTAALVRALVPLGPRAAAEVWGMVNGLAALGGAVVLGLALGGGGALPVSLLGLLFMGPMYNSLGLGQVEGLVFLALAVAFWGMARGRDVPLGAGLAVAAALKLTPAALIVYLLWRRRWRPALIAVATLALLTLVTLPVTGLHVFGQYVTRGFSLTEPGLVNVEPYNQTLAGVFGRLLLDQSTYGGFGTANLARGLALACAACLVSLTAYALWPRRESTASSLLKPSAEAGPSSLANEELLGFGAVVAVSLVVGPFTNYHQYFWLLIPLALLACRALASRRYGSVAVLAALLLAVDLNQVLWVYARWFTITTGLWRFLSLPFLFTLVLWGASLSAVFSDRRERAAARLPVEPVTDTAG